jgi:hypothetical protein
MSAPEETPKKEEKKEGKFELTSPPTRTIVNRKAMTPEQLKEYEYNKNRAYRMKEKQKRLDEARECQEAKRLNIQYQNELNEIKRSFEYQQLIDVELLKQKYDNLKEELIQQDDMRDELLEAYYNQIVKYYTKIYSQTIANIKQEQVIEKYLSKNDDKFINEFLDKKENFHKQVSKMNIN